ncbi:MAG: putative toxin-antitoxin system toxin component, PIN family [Deltaproteobacteria bacterium]|nr:putative toxin-antitoxin system toxin component, PIN family [Deltaproteobacteria bacterium]
MKLKIVFDTNIYISAFAIPGGKAEEAYLQAIKRKFILCSSLAILAETAKKLKEKFDWSEGKITDLLKAISKTATIVKTKPHIKVLTDDPDNRILECALKTKADHIVSGDKHLLSLKAFKGISILSLSDFVRMINLDHLQKS